MGRPSKSSKKLTDAFSTESASDKSGTRHAQVMEAILGAIGSGRLRSGDRLPTETELSKTFSASRSTVARAMRELKVSGLLDRRRGGGTRIVSRARRLALFAPFVESGPNLGHTGGMIYAHLSRLASKRSDDLCLQVVDHSHGGDLLDQLLAAVDEMVAKGIGGVFYYPLELAQESAHYNQLVVDKMRSAGLAVVLVDRDIVTFPRRSSIDLVTFDNYRGGYLAGDHMLRQGCKRIAFIGLPQASSAVTDRMRGYADALEDHDLHRDRSLLFRANIEDLTLDFCKNLMDESQADGIICKMDHYAAIVGRHLMELGVRIGRDVMLSGFDDQPIAGLLPVPLTTVRFPAEPFVNLSYERMLKRMGDPMGTDTCVTLVDVELVCRASTGCAATEMAKPNAELAVAASV